MIKIGLFKQNRNANRPNIHALTYFELYPKISEQYNHFIKLYQIISLKYDVKRNWIHYKFNDFKFNIFEKALKRICSKMNDLKIKALETKPFRN